MSRPPPQPPIPNGAHPPPHAQRRPPPSGLALPPHPQQGGITLGRSPGPLSPPISYGPDGTPLLASSPYLKSMALLDNMDLQQIMAGGDLPLDPTSPNLPVGALQRSPEAVLAALSAVAGSSPAMGYASLPPPGAPAPAAQPLRRITSHEQLTATAVAVAALASPQGSAYREMAAAPAPLGRLPPPAPPAAAAADEDSEAQRKSVRRERNREHARISRERKRQKLEHLQEENDALRRKEAVLVDERNRLRERLSHVEHENAQLRAWIRQHRGLDPQVGSPLLAPDGLADRGA